MFKLVGIVYFFQSLWRDVGVLFFPLLLTFSIACVITIEKAIFFLFVFKREKAITSLEDVIINNRSYPKQLREDLIAIELSELTKTLESGIGVLKFIASIATMFGLLGTVIGMIDVFSSIAGIKTAVSPNVISQGIKKAMYTTAYGLSISIFAITVSYFYERIITKIFNKVSEFAILLNAKTEYERLADVAKKKV